MAITVTPNQLRERSIRISRLFKGVFMGVPERFASVMTRWIWRWLFLGPDGRVHRGGRIVLADLREFCRADQPTNFSTNAMVMARREGRREVWERIVNYLNLDEHEVRKLMELDDGI